MDVWVNVEIFLGKKLIRIENTDIHKYYGLL